MLPNAMYDLRTNLIVLFPAECVDQRGNNRWVGFDQTEDSTLGIPFAQALQVIGSVLAGVVHRCYRMLFFRRTIASPDNAAAYHPRPSSRLQVANSLPKRLYGR